MKPSHSEPPVAPAIFSIRWVVTLASAFLIAVVVVVVGVVTERNARTTLTEALVARLCTQARSVALTSASAMLTPYPELTLHPLLLKMRQQQPEIALATVCDRSGAIHGDADPRQLGRPFVTPPELVPHAASPSIEGVSVFESPTLLLASAPIVHPNGAALGTVHLALERRAIEEAVTAARRPLLIVFCLLLAAGVAGSILLTSGLLKPIATLRAGLERIGRGDLRTRVKLDPRTDLGVLAETVNRMAAGLESAQAETIERERLAHEIRLAQHLQRSLLPAERLVAGGLVLDGTQRPAAEVGGDFYDAFHLPDGRVGIAIADVAGKGLGGCLVTSMLAALLVALRDGCREPRELLQALDRSLSQRLDRGAFVTMFVAFVDPRSGALAFASAGHHPALLVRAGGTAHWLDVPGLPLGVSRSTGTPPTSQQGAATIEPGDVLVLTTDGIHETVGGPKREAFGFDRIAATVQAVAPRKAQSVIAALFGALETWRGSAEPTDDETIAVVSWEGARAAADDPLASPMERLAEAKARGVALKLPATLEALVRLEDWLSRPSGAPDLREEERARVHLALHETCANIVEHGYRGKPGAALALWWVPAADAGETSSGNTSGYFLILDQGEPFAADLSKRTDIKDPGARRRGRGFGIELTRRAARRLVFHPGTPVGNVTLLAFDPAPDPRPHEEAA